MEWITERLMAIDYDDYLYNRVYCIISGFGKMSQLGFVVMHNFIGIASFIISGCSSWCAASSESRGWLLWQTQQRHYGVTNPHSSNTSNYGSSPYPNSLTFSHIAQNKSIPCHQFIPVYSHPHALSSEHNVPFLALFWPKLAYLSMLFIFQPTGVNWLKNK